MATGKTSASKKKSTAKAHSTHKSSRAKSAQTKTGQAKTGQAKTGQAKSTQAKSAQAKTGQAKSLPSKSLPAKVRQDQAASVAEHHAPTARPAITPSKTAHRRTSKSSKKAAAVASRRSAQQQPTAERYKEIQQALADRGYLQGTVDGNWGADSVEALKRFQRDQNITDDGKLGSLSLIALGLGPKRVAPIEPSPEKPAQQP